MYNKFHSFISIRKKNRQQIQQCELGGKQGGSAINGKEKRWQRGLEQSAAYQLTQGVKQKEKGNERKSQLSFFLKSTEKTIDTVVYL